MSGTSRRKTRSSSTVTTQETSSDQSVPATAPLKPKRKRSNTSNTNQKAKKRAVQQNQGEQDTEDAPVTHSHGTRPTNDPHPAQSAGVHKRTRAEISEAAASKQRARDVVAEQRERDSLEQKEREQRGIEGVAALLDARQRRDDAEETAMGEERGGQPTSNQQGYGKILDELRAGHSGRNSAAEDLPARKPTAAEKKRASVDNHHARLAAARSEEPVRPPQMPQTPRAETTHLNLYQAGLDTDWRSKVEAAGHAAIKSQKGHAVALRKLHPEEAIGGLSDGEVTEQRPAEWKGQRTPRTQHTATVIPIPDDNGPTPAAPLVKKRAAKSAVDPSKSTAYENLPGWAQPHFHPKTGTIIPTLCDFYGAQDDPWEMDMDDAVFILLLQALVDILEPGGYHTISKGDQVYQRARQGVYDWRRSFAKTALAAVKTKARELGTQARVKDFISRALRPEGEAFWKETNGVQCKGALRSSYVLETFAEHLRLVSGSSKLKHLMAHIEDQSTSISIGPGYPQGALLLSVCAVHCAFESFRTGVHLATSKFTKANVQDIEKDHLGSIKDNYTSRLHRFDTLIGEAVQYIRAKRSPPVTTPRRPARQSWTIREASSPPPMPQSDEEELTRRASEDDNDSMYMRSW